MSSIFSPPSSDFDMPSMLYQIISSPITFLTRLIYKVLEDARDNPPAPETPRIRVVCISDTHNKTRDDIPQGDLLIHAGDLTDMGTPSELREQRDWLTSIPGFQYKVVIAGNHDTWLDPAVRSHLPPYHRKQRVKWGTLRYLRKGESIQLPFAINPQPGSSTENPTVNGNHSDCNHSHRRLKITGWPQIPMCENPEFAFQYHPNDRSQWREKVPDDTDILVTHTPPRWHMDLPRGMGCGWLLEEVWRVQPKLHVFGHVHEGHGRSTVWWDDIQAAYERICEREYIKDWGFFGGILDFRNWIDIGVMVNNGLYQVGTYWKEDRNAPSIMINAALKNQKTGEIDNPIQVVDI